MPIKIIKGDLLDTKADLIAHGVNSKGKFASGVAGAIAKKWPIVKKEYLYKYKSVKWYLGEVQIVCANSYDSHYPLVANMCTQENYGNDGKLYLSYSALQSCLNSVLSYAQANDLTVAMPKVGAGLAGGDWFKIYDILYELSLKYDSVAIEVYEL